MTYVVLALLGIVGGALGAAVGVGGGVVFVPALAVVAGFDQHLSEGTSLAVILPTMIVAAATHARGGRVHRPAAIRIGFFGIIGGLAGARLALSLDELLLRRLFAVLLVVIALRMLRRTQRAVHEE
jgi:uncharacterized membrane protein YfcA